MHFLARTLGVGNPLLIAKHGVSAMHCCPWGHTPSATPLEHCTALFCEYIYGFYHDIIIEIHVLCRDVRVDLWKKGG